ncbi:hypothetical protein F511_30050 [Dorcoceras hygrometricum]|uniref:Uncharacterized protein n=1 Tax=Dorcoceras hygrometricum TaxID=472368 RepID=A0A2Z7DGD5_9LAMI|nr:hypothetical protein F511_30050 [Dorcoceras hygrometricum]
MLAGVSSGGDFSNRIEELLQSQYKIEVPEPVLVVQTGEPVAIQYSSEGGFHRKHRALTSSSRHWLSVISSSGLMLAGVSSGGDFSNRIEELLQSQYKIEVPEPVLVVQTGEPVAIQYSSERVFHRNHFMCSNTEKKTDIHY